jgi:hypothetical protein
LEGVKRNFFELMEIGGESFQTGNWIEPIKEEEGIDGVEQQLNLEEGE